LRFKNSSTFVPCWTGSSHALTGKIVIGLVGSSYPASDAAISPEKNDPLQLHASERHVSNPDTTEFSP
jgi:hypothetical protein